MQPELRSATLTSASLDSTASPDGRSRPTPDLKSTETDTTSRVTLPSTGTIVLAMPPARAPLSDAMRFRLPSSCGTKRSTKSGTSDELMTNSCPPVSSAARRYSLAITPEQLPLSG
jgi:hypothetical protein